MNHKDEIVRRYALEMTDSGTTHYEFGSEAHRNGWSANKNDSQNDWYCLDVYEDFSVEVYLATTGPEALEKS